MCHGLQLCGCYLLQMFSGRKLRVDLAESSGGDRERGDNFGRSGQFAVVVTFLSKLKLLLASKKGTEVPARDKEVFFLKAVCCMPIQQTAFLKYFHVPCGKLGSPYLVRQSSHKSSATHS